MQPGSILLPVKGEISKSVKETQYCDSSTQHKNLKQIVAKVFIDQKMESVSQCAQEIANKIKKAIWPKKQDRQIICAITPESAYALDQKTRISGGGIYYEYSLVLPEGKFIISLKQGNTDT